MPRHRRAILTLTVVLAALFGPSLALVRAQADATATFRGGPDLTGQQPGPAPQGEPTLRWRFETGGKVKSSPVVVGGAVYFGSKDGHVYAVDAQSGEERWRFRTTLSVRSAPAVADGVVFVGGDDRFLYALDAESGQELWRFETGAMAAPTVVDGVAFVAGDDSYLHAIDVATGLERWHFAAPGLSKAAPAVVDGIAFIGAADLVYALDATNGTPFWVSPLGFVANGTLAVNDGTIYIVGALSIVDETETKDNRTDDGNAGSANAEQIDDFAGDQSGGDQATDDQSGGDQAADDQGGDQTDDGDDVSINIVVNEDDDENDDQTDESGGAASGVAVRFFNGTLFALDAATGAGRWEQPFTFSTGSYGVSMLPTAPAVLGETVFVGSPDGQFYAVDAATGVERWGRQIGDRVTSAPAVVDNVVYFGGFDEHLHAVDGESGTELWRFQTGDWIESSPAIIDGVIYVGSDDGFLYAVGGS